VMGGLLLSGRKGESPGAGNGDCILLDGPLGLAGIADGSERSPQASRKFLKGLSDLFSDKAGHRGDDLLRILVDAAQEVLDSFPYEDRTTFLCVLFTGQDTLCYINGGDSLLFHLDPVAARIRYRNRANMGFAGRSNRVVDSGRIHVNQGDLILLATDGVWDLTEGDSEQLVRAFFKSLHQGPFHQATERMARERHPAFYGDKERSYDDFSAVLVDPYRMSGLPWRLIAGGTSDAAEGTYRVQRSQSAYPDRFVPIAARDRDFWTFPEDLSLLK